MSPIYAELQRVQAPKRKDSGLFEYSAESWEKGNLRFYAEHKALLEPRIEKAAAFYRSQNLLEKEIECIEMLGALAYTMAEVYCKEESTFEFARECAEESEKHFLRITQIENASDKKKATANFYVATIKFSFGHFGNATRYVRVAESLAKGIHDTSMVADCRKLLASIRESKRADLVSRPGK